jgi:serine/threonine protein kinase
VEFYASFEHRGSFNLVLEYAEGGTLEDALNHWQAPSCGSDIIHLWNSVFEVVHGLFWIHDRHRPSHGVLAGVYEQGYDHSPSV